LVAAGIAAALVKDSTVSGKSDDGRQTKWEAINSTGGKSVLSTAKSRTADGLGHVLRFDGVSDDWSMTDDQLREVDVVSFTDDAGIFYHMDIAQIQRYDSGPIGADADKLEVLTVPGHELRFWESVGTLELKFAGTTLWTTINTAEDPATRRLQDLVVADESMEPTSVAAFEPPPRLLSKGHFVGGVYVHRSGGGFDNSQCRSMDTGGRCGASACAASRGVTWCNRGYCSCKAGWCANIQGVCVANSDDATRSTGCTFLLLLIAWVSVCQPRMST